MNSTFTEEWRNRHDKILSAYNEALKQNPNLTEKEFIEKYVSENDVKSGFRFLFTVISAEKLIDKKKIIETDINKIIANMTIDEWKIYLRTRLYRERLDEI